jgi:glutamate-1-semialdehyde aminotransferase
VFGLSSRYGLLQVACLRLSPPSLALLMAVTTASAAPLAGAALDALLDRITVLKQQQKALEAELSPLLEQLSEALETGELDASFSHNGCSFCWSAGRTSYAYPEPLQQQQQALKEAQRLAVATGAATEKQGKAFWTIKPVRS